MVRIADRRSHRTFFQVVQAGTVSYSAGGFDITVPDVSLIQNASVFMTPETLLATTKNVGLVLTYTGNVATVKVLQRSAAALWTEVANATNLSGANFILTGKGV
jgi:hypothetical protein